MENYYKELSDLKLLKNEITRFALALKENKSGCFEHRVSELIIAFIIEFRNTIKLRNDVHSHINSININEDVKYYLTQLFTSFFELIEIKTPESLTKVIDGNKEFDMAMIEGRNAYNRNYEIIDSQKSNNEPEQDEVNVFRETMPLSIPKEHFKVLTVKNSKNGKPFLTQDQFDTFINRAFLGKFDLPKLKFNQAPKGEKLKIQYLFRQFYENYCFEYFDTGQTQNVFIALLTENFTGWDFKNVKDNFKTKPKKLI